eukprot:Gb_17390 [translate_table: standard]
MLQSFDIFQKCISLDFIRFESKLSKNKVDMAKMFVCNVDLNDVVSYCLQCQLLDEHVAMVITTAAKLEDCTKRWFQDTLKEAKEGDTEMQILVAQMYYSGYGIPQDAQKARTWFQKASKAQSRVTNLTAKQPGFNASESDSDEQK